MDRTLNVVIAGASGRMGRTLIEAVARAPHLRLHAALDRADSPSIAPIARKPGAQRTATSANSRSPSIMEIRSACGRKPRFVMAAPTASSRMTLRPPRAIPRAICAAHAPCPWASWSPMTGNMRRVRRLSRLRNPAA